MRPRKAQLYKSLGLFTTWMTAFLYLLLLILRLVTSGRWVLEEAARKHAVVMGSNLDAAYRWVDSVKLWLSTGSCIAFLGLSWSWALHRGATKEGRAKLYVLGLYRSYLSKPPGRSPWSRSRWRRRWSSAESTAWRSSSRAWSSRCTASSSPVASCCAARCGIGSSAAKISQVKILYIGFRHYLHPNRNQGHQAILATEIVCPHSWHK